MLACAQPVAASVARVDDAGRKVEVRAGQEVTVAAHKLKIKFVAVREDSRCPQGVQCIWAGNARIAVTLSRARAKAANVELNTMTGAREIAYGNYTVELASLAPHPVQSVLPKARDYVATFVVSKKH
jgi:hypothetical protein